VAKKSPKLDITILPRFRVYWGADIVMGPGKAELLEHIASTGSISQAAKLMKMSYNRAWLHVKVMNENFQEPLVNSSRGGTEGGGASLTETGKLVLKHFRQMEQETLLATKKTQRALCSLLKISK
jgi:molybdate transport system regulatory protein